MLDRRFTLPFVLLALAAWTSAGSAEEIAVDADASESEKARIAGSVVDPEGAPVAGATVRIRDDPRHAGGGVTPTERTILETEENGSFVADGLEGEKFWIRVEAAGFAPDPLRQVGAGATVAIRLRKGNRITGSVVDRDSATPLSGAEVRVCDARSVWFGDRACAEARTDADGRFVVADLAEGPHSIMAVAAAHEKRVLEEVRVPPAADPESGEPTTVVLILGAGGRVAGRVADADGTPVEDALVWLSPLDPPSRRTVGVHPGLDDRSDADGRFEIEGVPIAERYRIEAKSTDYAPLHDGPFPVRQGSDVSRDLVLTKGASLRFRLVDAEAGPVERPTVSRTATDGSKGNRRLEVDEGRIEQGEDGRATIRRLAPGLFRFEFQPEGYSTIVRKDVVLEEGETTDLGTLVARPGKSIAGRVEDEAAEPVGAARVTARWRGENGYRVRTARTDDDGSYRLGGLDDIDLGTVTVSAPSFVPGSRTNVTPGDEDVDFALTRTGSVSGRVVQPDGAPARQFRVEVHAEVGRTGEKRARGFFGEDGTFELPGIYPGAHTIVARVQGRVPARKTGVRVESGKDTDVGELSLRAGLTLAGRVVSARDEQPIAGAGLSIAPPTVLGQPLFDEAATASSGMDGSFRFDGLEEGSVSVVAEHPEYSRGEVRVLLSAEGPQDEVIVSLTRGGTLEGSVVDAEGIPLEGVRILLTRAAVTVDGETTETGPDGRYRFEQVSPGSYVAARLPVDDADKMEIKTAAIEEGETTVVDFGDAARIRLTGHLRRGEAPVAGAMMMFAPRDDRSTAIPDIKSASSDEEGFFSASLDEAGSYEVMVDAGTAGGMPRPVEIVVPDEPEVYREISLPTLGVTGRVTDSLGEPLPDAVILAIPDDTSEYALFSRAETDRNGDYAVEGLEPGIYRLTAQAEGFATAERYPVAVDDESQAIDFRLDPGRALRGRVVDPQGRGVANAIVLHGLAGLPATMVGGDMTTTDVNGAFRLTAAEAVDLAVVAGGWAPAFAPGVMPQDDPDAPAVTIRLASGGTLLVSVASADGAPVAGDRVMLRPLDEHALATFFMTHSAILTTDAAGRITIELLAPGPYEVAAPGVTPQRVDVIEGQQASVALSVTQP